MRKLISEFKYLTFEKSFNKIKKLKVMNCLILENLNPFDL